MYYLNGEGMISWETVGVIAIYMPNVTEIPFEEGRDSLARMYYELVRKSFEMMRRENGYMDMIIHNAYIGGVFCIKDEKDREQILQIARNISEKLPYIIRKSAELPEQMLFGIGVSFGAAARIAEHEKEVWGKGSIWIGQVFENACFLAGRAICDGRRTIMTWEMIFQRG